MWAMHWSFCCLRWTIKLERQLDSNNHAVVLILNDHLYLSKESFGLAFEVCIDGFYSSKLSCSALSIWNTEYIGWIYEVAYFLTFFYGQHIWCIGSTHVKCWHIFHLWSIYFTVYVWCVTYHLIFYGYWLTYIFVGAVSSILPSFVKELLVFIDMAPRF